VLILEALAQAAALLAFDALGSSPTDDMVYTLLVSMARAEARLNLVIQLILENYCA
jgi:hypothetical protein